MPKESLRVGALKGVVTVLRQLDSTVLASELHLSFESREHIRLCPKSVSVLFAATLVWQLYPKLGKSTVFLELLVFDFCNVNSEVSLVKDSSGFYCSTYCESNIRVSIEDLSLGRNGGVTVLERTRDHSV